MKWCGKAIAVVGGSTNDKAVMALIKAGKPKDAKLIVVKDYAEGIAAIESKQADPFAADDTLRIDRYTVDQHLTEVVSR